jgi:hypothetical protein
VTVSSIARPVAARHARAEQTASDIAGRQSPGSAPARRRLSGAAVRRAEGGRGQDEVSPPNGSWRSSPRSVATTCTTTPPSYRPSNPNSPPSNCRSSTYSACPQRLHPTPEIHRITPPRCAECQQRGAHLGLSHDLGSYCETWRPRIDTPPPADHCAAHAFDVCVGRRLGWGSRGPRVDRGSVAS